MINYTAFHDWELQHVVGGKPVRDIMYWINRFYLVIPACVMFLAFLLVLVIEYYY